MADVSSVGVGGGVNIGDILDARSSLIIASGGKSKIKNLKF